MFYDITEIKKSIETMKPDGQLFEIRIIGSGTTYSGYFRQADSMIEQLKKINLQGVNVYISLNGVNEACYSRSQCNRFERSTRSTTTTSDKDILTYEWLMIDLDPKRPAGTSSSNEQLLRSRELQINIFKFMQSLGFNEPLAATSGNGYHLLYKIHFANNEVNKRIVERTLKTLDMLFSNEYVSVDTANFNPSRICKLYGTMAQKGTNSKERPHRMSAILSKSLDFKATDIKYLEKLCSYYPQEEKPQEYNNFSPHDFNLRDWMSKFGLRYKESSYSGGTKYILDSCPFDSNHKGKDACIFQGSNGRIGFHCFHASCADKTWKDVRRLFEPDAYEKRNEEYRKKIYSNEKKIAKIVQTEGEPVFFSASDILNLPVVEESFVKTGIKGIDHRLRGLKKGYVSLMSGLRAAGKSSVISGMILDCVNNKKRVCVYSGELTPKNFMQWLFRQAAGLGHVEPTDFENYYTVGKRTQVKIAKWLDGYFWLYNNKYGNDYRAILGELKKHVKEKSLDMLILDNMMALNIKDLSDNKFNAQTEFVLSLQELAKSMNVHILFVAHPRKALGFLRLDDISGSADLANAVDNAFIVHRVNNDFKRLTAMTFGLKDDNDIYSATNVIEIAKDRDGGTMDCFVPLYYETETKRLKNSIAENKLYGWCKDESGFEEVNINEETPFSV